MKQGITFGMGSFLFPKPCLNLSTDSTIVKPSEVHFELNDLIEAIENDGNDIEIDEQDTQLFRNYVTDGSFQAKFGKMIFDFY